MVTFLVLALTAMTVLVVRTVIEKGPLIFLTMAQYTHGHIDGTVRPFPASI